MKVTYLDLATGKTEEVIRLANVDYFEALQKG